MVSLDTNILARLLLGDDAGQLVRAKALLSQAQQFTAPVTVMLELVWVLEANGIEAGDIATGLEKLLKLPNFKPTSAAEILYALQSYKAGLDFADALHLALSASSQRMASFEKAFVKRAKKLGLEPQVEEPP
jgi:predicted nucleic-acid-binding protein